VARAQALHTGEIGDVARGAGERPAAVVDVVTSFEPTVRDVTSPLAQG
jgi:hypothetical protein